MGNIKDNLQAQAEQTTPTFDDMLHLDLVSYDPNEEITDRVLTIPNVISFIRLCMVPVFFFLLMRGYNIHAAVVFGIAASTDFVDGQIARRTHSVSKLGKLLDPAVDRILMITGVIGLFLVGRLPLWIILLVIARDMYLLIAGGYMLDRYHERVDVIFPGKVATTFMFLGFFGLIMNAPLIPGLGITSYSWLPGIAAGNFSWGIWFVYLGLVVNIFTTTYYIRTAFSKTHDARMERKMRKMGK